MQTTFPEWWLLTYSRSGSFCKTFKLKANVKQTRCNKILHGLAKNMLNNFIHVHKRVEWTMDLMVIRLSFRAAKANPSPSSFWSSHATIFWFSGWLQGGANWEKLRPCFLSSLAHSITVKPGVKKWGIKTCGWSKRERRPSFTWSLCSEAATARMQPPL